MGAEEPCLSGPPSSNEAKCCMKHSPSFPFSFSWGRRRVKAALGGKRFHLPQSRELLLALGMMQCPDIKHVNKVAW